VPRRKTAGQRLVTDLTQQGDPYAITVMIVEAGRIADRLEKLDGILIGQQTIWATLQSRYDGDVVEVRVDGALAEARQQATVLRHLIAEIHKQRGQTRSAPTDDDLAGL
jgi:hypothetical protein